MDSNCLFDCIRLSVGVRNVFELFKKYDGLLDILKNYLYNNSISDTINNSNTINTIKYTNYINSLYILLINVVEYLELEHKLLLLDYIVSNKNININNNINNSSSNIKYK